MARQGGFNLRMLAAFAAAIILAACGSTPPPQDASTALDLAEYRLGSGDQMRLIVFGEPDLSGEFTIDGTGFIALPLIGDMRAANMTLRELEDSIEAKLRDGYLTDPRVSAEVINYRPFYIIGEVQNGGEYPFVSGMTVISAIARAGGYTYRADTRRVFVTHAEESKENEYPSQNTLVMPGDIIRVPERLF